MRDGSGYCLTVTVLDIASTPVPVVTVTTALLSASVSFRDTVMDSEPFPFPEAGETVHHPASEAAVQTELQFTSMLNTSPLSPDST